MFIDARLREPVNATIHKIVDGVDIAVLPPLFAVFRQLPPEHV
jgi:hypothetical protein